MTANALPAYYGMRELKGLYRRFTAEGMMVAVLLHFAVVGGYYFVRLFEGPDDTPVTRIFSDPFVFLDVQPSIANVEAIPQVKVSVAPVAVSKGIPVPVPDAQVNPDQTIASQKELQVMQGPPSDIGEGEAGRVIPPDIQIEEVDPPPFQQVEIEPTLVRAVAPEYPEFARRIGVEGTVVVRMLVDRQGKVKKALVETSSNELFNESAVRAALKYVFTPAVMNNGTVPVWVHQPFKFRLRLKE